MRNKVSSIIWGILFILVGFGFIGNAFDLWNFELFFNGWWTLFIIVPSVLGIIQHGPRPFAISCLIIGVLLLLSCQGYIRYDIVERLAIPIILIVIGVCILGKSVGFNYSRRLSYVNKDGLIDYSAIFAGQNIIYNENELFLGATLNSVFGGIKLDLRSAIINEDVIIETTAIFGGADIFLPDDVNVKISSTPIFGGVSNKRQRLEFIDNVPTVYINAVSMFGGVDIK